MRGWPLIKLLPQKTNLHFVKHARLAGIVSVVLCVASIVACFYPGLNMGIDFRGGAVMEMTKPNDAELDIGAVREAVAGLNLGDVGVQGIDNASSAIVRFQVPEGEAQNAVVGGCSRRYARKSSTFAACSSPVVAKRVSPVARSTVTK